MGVGKGYLIGAPQSDVIVNNAYSGVQSIVFMNSDTEIHANISASYLVNKNKWIFSVESMNIAYGTAASPTYGGKYFVMVTQGSATTGIPCLRVPMLLKLPRSRLMVIGSAPISMICRSLSLK